MKVCVETHRVAAFGEIPEGSLWADDSPYVVDEEKFAVVGAEEAVPPSAAKVEKLAPKKKGDA